MEWPELDEGTGRRVAALAFYGVIAVVAATVAVVVLALLLRVFIFISGV